MRFLKPIKTVLRENFEVLTYTPKIPQFNSATHKNEKTESLNSRLTGVHSFIYYRWEQFFNNKWSSRGVLLPFRQLSLFLFTLGKISVDLVMCLAVDRWFAIYRPLRYQTVFKRRIVIRNVMLVVLTCCIMNSRPVFEKCLVLKDNVSMLISYILRTMR